MDYGNTNTFQSCVYNLINKQLAHIILKFQNRIYIWSVRSIVICAHVMTCGEWENIYVLI